MGGALKTAGGGLGGVVGGVGGLVNGIASPLGLGGEQGDYMHAQTANAGAAALNDRAGLMNDSGNNTLLNQYGTGELGLNDVLKRQMDREGTYLTPQQRAAFTTELATNPLTGSKFATEQVQQNPLLGQLFGKGGTMDRTNAEEQRLSSQGFQLTPEDREAYGQASGDIARLFGSQEQNLSQSLADRGLASAPSGAAGVAFSGLQGNKNEQLAKAQMDIANQRMNNTMQRLGQTRSFLSQLGGQAEHAIQDQYGRQLSGAQQGNQNLMSAAQAQNMANQTANQGNLASLQDQRGAAGKTLLGAAGQGLYAGTGAAFGGSISGLTQSSIGTPGGSAGPGMQGEEGMAGSAPSASAAPKGVPMGALLAAA